MQLPYPLSGAASGDVHVWYYSTVQYYFMALLSSILSILHVYKLVKYTEYLV